MHGDMCSDVRRVSRGRHPPGNGSGLNHGPVFTVGGMAGPAEMSSPNEQILGPGTPGGPGETWAAQLIAVIDFFKVKFLEFSSLSAFPFNKLSLYWNSDIMDMDSIHSN